MTETATGGQARHPAVTRTEAHTAFREAVRAGLERSGMLQKELAAAVGKSAVDISRYLSSPARLPKDWTLIHRILTTAGADIVTFQAGPGRWWGIEAPVEAEPDTVADALAAPTSQRLDLPAPRPASGADRYGQGIDRFLAEPMSGRPLAGEGAHKGPATAFGLVDGVPVATSAAAPTYRMTPLPERTPSDAGSQRPRRPRWLLVTVALGNAVVLVAAAVAAGVILSAPRTETVNPLPAPPELTTAGPWPSTIDSETPSPGVALHSAPTKSQDTEINRLPAGAAVDIECGVVGDLTTTRAGKQTTTWLRTPAGAYLSAHYVDFTGPDPIPNCEPGAPDVSATVN